MTLESPSAAAAVAAAAADPQIAAASSPTAQQQQPQQPPLVLFTYDQIHRQISEAVEGPRAIFASWRPTLLLCISGGGLVPTRILRSCLKRVAERERERAAAVAAAGPAAATTTTTTVPNVPVQCVGLQLYDTEGLDPATSAPMRTQWIEHDAEAAAAWAVRRWREEEHERQGGGGKGGGGGAAAPSSAAQQPPRPPLCLQGQRVLVVDEVDDSRATLAACCAEIEADAARERGAYERLRADAISQAAANDDAANLIPPEWRECEVGVFVVHNKRRVKRGVLPDSIIMRGLYWASAYLPDCWIRYPWDADCIDDHSQAAKEQHARVRVLPPAAAAEANGGGGANGPGATATTAARARRRTDAAAPELVI
jgi:uncharacterized protein